MKAPLRLPLSPRWMVALAVGLCAAPLLAQPAASGPVTAGPADSGKLTIEAQRARVEQARNQAASCAVCHGPDGRPPAGSPVPRLAGRSQADLVELMLDYKLGKRPGTVMPQIAKGYSDTEIIGMAAWFADQK
ncbi:MAG: cytochrome C [Cupriavidus sp.]|uniref:c-type cytochrome n=1 Tax=Cupriavidus pauculus TaxID=82633 RepID=UPI000A04BD31|nr:cytochrome C [Cupriavidus pauculus]KAB0598409.1 cytochrome C [Cupriavidus pauculus]MBU65513.1 cytochrome C [Cupriavidus sp.]MCM3603907.1 cytochrome C [Cupriavidus pauculus]